MKNLLLIIVALFTLLATAKSQCLAHIKYTAAKMEMVDSALNVRESKDVTTVFETTEKGFTATQEGDDNVFKGTLKSLTCDWKELYKNGKMQLICDIQSNNEDLHDVKITVEASDGKISILLDAKEHPGELIRLIVDKYEEVK
jgi:hypothetical protein